MNRSSRNYRKLGLIGVVLFGLGLVEGWGVLPSGKPELPNLDKRVSHAAKARAPDPTKQAPLAQLKARLPNAKVDWDEAIGTPKLVAASDGFLSEPDGRGKGISAASADAFGKADPDRAVKAFLKEYSPLFGHGSEGLTTARVKREHVTPHNGLRTVVWEQQLDDIAVFEGLLVAHTTKQGELVQVSSQFIPHLEQAAEHGTPERAVVRAAPAVSAAQAVAVAAQNVGETLTASQVLASSNAEATAEARQQFKGSGLKGECSAKLIWLPLDKETLRLCWDVLFTSRSRGEMFRVLVDVQTGEVLVRRCLTDYISNASYRVFSSDSPSPFSPGHPTPQSSQPPLVSRSLMTLSALDTNASPNGWINDGGNETLGNNVDAHLDRNADDAPDLPRPQGSPFRVFDFPVDLAGQDPTNYGAAAVVQLFYTCNWMHDRLYELGFTEAAGNFQSNNYGRGGLGNDAVQADAQDGEGTDNANMSTPPDGSAPRMQMFIFTGPNPRRDGDLDAEIVLHEYTHGLSNRRVGGGVGLSALQSRGMGEGWSDFYALALLSEAGDNVNGNYASGAYASYLIGAGFLQNYYYGIRRYPYSTDLMKNPLTFKDIDPAQASGHTGVPISPVMGGGSASEVHNQGEVWCVTLWEARANLINKYGWAVGSQLILQLVTDGMNLSPANPTFLQARDAIIQADRVNTGGANRNELWTAFAKRGMGASATSPTSSTTSGVHEAYDLPDDLQITPNSGFTASGPVGGPFTPDSLTLVLTNTDTNLINWTLANTSAWLNVSLSGGTLAPSGPSSAVAVSLNVAAGSLPMGVYTATVRFTNQRSGMSQGRQFVLRIGQPDYFTELFDAGDNDLAFSSYTFAPDGSASFYHLCREVATNFPTDPTGGTLVGLSDDSYAQVTLSGTNTVALYNRRTNVFFIGSNGYITMGSGDSTYTESLTAHFNWPRIAALFDDLDPGSRGTISWKALSNRVAVTYVNVPEYGTYNTNSFQIEMFYDGRVRITYLAIAARDGLAGLSAGQGLPTGFLESDLSAYGACSMPLLVTVPASATEGDGVLAGQGHVMLPARLATNLTVNLYCNDTTEVIVPATVTVLAGQTNADFDVTIVADAELDGIQVATITAAASGYYNSSATITVYDHETATLQVSLPEAVVEGGGTTQGVVLVSAPPAANVAVSLVSSDASEIQVPAWIIIPAGQTSTVFTVTIMDDTLIDGPQTAVVTAYVPNWTDGTATITVLDNESLDLTVTVPASATEGDGVLTNAGQARLFGAQPTNLVVTLESSDLTEATLPATVTIPAGVVSAAFDVTIVDDPILDGNQSVTITASAEGFNAGSTTLTVVDAESPPRIVTQPTGVVVGAGSRVNLSVVATGTSPLSYQWRKEGLDLNDGGNVLGTTTATLILSNVLKSDEGNYSVFVSNVFGTLTSAIAVVTVLDPTITTQPVSQSVNPGQSGLFRVTATGTAPLGYQWRKEGAILDGAVEASLTLTNVQGAESGNYDVVVSNVFGSATSLVAVLTVNLVTVDVLNPNANGNVYTFAMQVDGKILVGGDFTSLAGQTRKYLGRLNADGSVDTSFNPGANGPVYSLAVQTNGQILVGGDFTALSGQPRHYLGRLNADGGVDGMFDPGADGSVYALVVQTDGQILVGGEFITLGGLRRDYLGRLKVDGSIDTAFNPAVDAYVCAVAVQPDGQILVGGDFLILGGQTRFYLGRLNSEGTLDTSFNPGANNWVQSLSLQANGQILVGGAFTTLGGQTRTYLGRLNPDGTLDTAFSPAADSLVYSLAAQANGQILVGGAFTRLGGQTRHCLGRLKADGSVDTTFNPGANGYVCSLAVQVDGEILVGGGFTTLGGQPRSCLGRLNNTALASDTLTFDGSTIVWLRSGASPEVWRTSFDVSINGNDWLELAAGTRVAGGWQVTGLALPIDTAIRARGYITGGYGNASAWFAEASVGRAAISRPPADCTDNAGTVATFSFLAGGTPPLSCRWLKEGVPLDDGGNIFGAATTTLILSNVLKTDEGGYSVIVSNAFGTVTSMVARLTVLDPFITNQPASQSADVGQSALFSVLAAGTPPLSYQWRKNGADRPGATGMVLLLTNVQSTDVGSYDVIVNNRFASVTSAVAMLTVNLVTADSFDPGADDLVYALAVQTDGKVLVGGCFTSLGGEARRWLGRLEADGTLDTSFNPGVGGDEDAEVDCLAVQTDSKILVGGWFDTLGGQPRSCLGRLNFDGTLDTAFNPGANSDVYSLAVQANGNILVGGEFTALGGVPRNGLGRLYPDGSLDASFNPGADAGAGVYCLAQQVDGKILVGGWFSTLAGQPRQNLGRLNADGTLDTSFTADADSTVSSLAVQTDGRILVGGWFWTLRGQPRYGLGRLNANGTLDMSFNPAVGGNEYAGVCSLAVQTDGKLLVGGRFTTVGGQPRDNIARLNVDGTLDSFFNPGAEGGSYGAVYSQTAQVDGKTLVGGWFSTLAGVPRGNLGRLNNTDPVTHNLTFTRSNITWIRFGTSPEVWRTSFEYSTNWTVWSTLGAGARVYGGWVLTGLALPTNAIIRARGAVTGGSEGSSWFVEAYSPITPLAIVNQPATLVSSQGGSATFSVTATGTPPVSYRWRKAGIDLVDGGNVSGVRTAVLSLSNVQLEDVGYYDVVLTNIVGSVTSQVAALWVMTVPEPQIMVQPESQSVVPRSNVTFNVTAIGVLPLSYRWYLRGTNLPGATNASLTITNVNTNHLGAYFMVVSNAYGMATSQVAILDFFYSPVIVQPPQSQTVMAGEDVTFTVTITNNAGLPIGYRWRKGSATLTNLVLHARTCSLTLGNVRTNVTATNGPGNYQVIVTNAASYTPGLASSYATLTVVMPPPPLVTTLPATDLTRRGATLNGEVNPNGFAATAWFEYGLTASYGNASALTNVGNGTNLVALSHAVAGLLPGTNYHYWLVATNWGGVTRGADMEFQTRELPRPLITRCGSDSSGQFELRFEGVSGAEYGVQVSTNLVDWVSAGVATETEPGTFEFTDANAPNRTTYFYRLRSP